MKANMKKCVVLGLALTMVVGSLSACGGTSSDPATSTSPTSTGSSEAKEKKVLPDLGGISVKIGDWYTADVTSNTAYDKATVKFRKDNEDKYNYKISRKNEYSYADMQDLYVQGVVGNNPKVDLWFLYQEKVSQPMMQGLMYNLSTVPTLDLTEEKWNPLVNTLMTINGGQYGMTAEQEPRGGIFFNKRMFTDAGIDKDLPYKLQKSGQWTWAAFEDLCKKLTKDTNNDGKTDQYALASFSKEYLPLVAATNNAGFVGRDKDGKYENLIGTSEFSEAMNWGVGLIEKGYVKPKPEGAQWDWFIAAFRDCEVAMQCAETYKTSTFSEMADEWGFVLFPKNQKNAKAEMKTIPNDNIVVIPSCFDAAKVEKIGQAFDLYTQDTPGFDGDDAWMQPMYSKFKDTKAVEETLVMMRDEKYKAISYLPMISDLDYGEFCYAVYARAATPQKKIEEITSKWDAKIADMNKKYDNFKGASK